MELVEGNTAEESWEEMDSRRHERGICDGWSLEFLVKDFPPQPIPIRKTICVGLRLSIGMS